MKVYQCTGAYARTLKTGRVFVPAGTVVIDDGGRLLRVNPSNGQLIEMSKNHFEASFFSEFEDASAAPGKKRAVRRKSEDSDSED